MDFNRHSDLVGQHAFLSASKYHWVNYTEEKLEATFLSAMATRRGTELHELAHNLIRLGVKLPKTPTTLNMYVNDALGFRMRSEQVLYVSENCFGTADAISYSARLKKLRIHDLKTGTTATSHHQLEIYAAMFCLEYHFKPTELAIELRIYQNDETRIYEADPDVIAHIMDRILFFDQRINELKGELK